MTGHLVSASLSPVDQARAEQLTTIAGGDQISLRPGVGVADGSVDMLTGWLDARPHTASTQQLSDASLDGGVDTGRRRAFRQLEALLHQIASGGRASGRSVPPGRLRDAMAGRRRERTALARPITGPRSPARGPTPPASPNKRTAHH